MQSVCSGESVLLSTYRASPVRTVSNDEPPERVLGAAGEGVLLCSRGRIWPKDFPTSRAGPAMLATDPCGLSPILHILHEALLFHYCLLLVFGEGEGTQRGRVYFFHLLLN